MNEHLLDQETIRGALNALALRLERRRVRADVYVFGGAAMVLAYGADRATRDVDAVFSPHGPVLEEARLVAEEVGLPPWWLHEQATVYLSRQQDAHAAAVFDHPYLRVQASSAEHLVAMKALAGRQHDLEDLRLLIDRLGLRSPDEVLRIVADVFPDQALPDRKRMLIEDLFLRP
ncbi:MAG: DUF6036 family nucleotidyltransferase [Egibacteraceae bacterium]